MRSYWALHPKQRALAAERRRARRIANPDLVRSQERASRERHRASVLARKAKYRKENVAKILEYNRAYNARNPAVLGESRRRWVKKNPSSISERKAKRRAAELLAMPSWSDRVAIKRIYEECKEITRQCGGKWHVDHVIPLQGKTVCGLHVPANLRVIPAEENAKKSNRLIEWGPV